MNRNENGDIDLLDSLIEQIDFSSIEIAVQTSMSAGISFAANECKGIDPYDTASLYVKKSAEQP